MLLSKVVNEEKILKRIIDNILFFGYFFWGVFFFVYAALTFKNHANNAIDL